MKHVIDPDERPIDPPEEDNEDEPYLDYSDIPSSSFIDSSLESTDTMDIQQDIVDNSNLDTGSPPRELETRQDTDKVEDTTSPIDNVNVFAAEKIVKKRTRKDLESINDDKELKEITSHLLPWIQNES
ncbi:hypothetical protein AC249_AIPGENE11512 [Exaiptasia diaphana]|nr:hypothetical protein AC249_AIPGENE11512 [Exaiptasia diaphana]